MNNGDVCACECACFNPLSSLCLGRAVNILDGGFLWCLTYVQSISGPIPVIVCLGPSAFLYPQLERGRKFWLLGGCRLTGLCPVYFWIFFSHSFVWDRIFIVFTTQLQGDQRFFVFSLGGEHWHRSGICLVYFQSISGHCESVLYSAFPVPKWGSFA